VTQSEQQQQQREEDAFGRLECLLEQLPVMEAKGKRLSRAREAQRLLELQKHFDVLKREYDEYHRVRDTALLAAREAGERGDNAAQSREQGTVRGYAELIALRTAPLQRARLALEEAWASSPLSPGAPLEDEVLDGAELAALEQEIAEYQRDYQETYALCQQLEKTI
jgi:hypothetical protein